MFSNRKHYKSRIIPKGIKEKFQNIEFGVGIYRHMNFINIDVLVSIKSNIYGVLLYITNFSKQIMHVLI